MFEFGFILTATYGFLFGYGLSLLNANRFRNAIISFLLGIIALLASLAC